MSSNQIAHKCKCDNQMLGVISHGSVYCQSCEGFIADVDDMVLYPTSGEKTHSNRLETRHNTFFNHQYCRVCGRKNCTSCDSSDFYSEDK